jgi:hypothetical protein
MWSREKLIVNIAVMTTCSVLEAQAQLHLTFIKAAANKTKPHPSSLNLSLIEHRWYLHLARCLPQSILCARRQSTLDLGVM